MAKIEYSVCDIDKCQNKVSEDYQKRLVPIIFTTEQTEGRTVTPYLAINKLDICKEHYDHISKGNFIYAHGAQGYNTYYFKNE